MENKQTAVDFLIHEISEIVGIIAPDAFSVALIKIKYEQAKAMEKEQILNACHHGVDYDKSPYKNAEEYYNKTYGTPR